MLVYFADFVNPESRLKIGLMRQRTELEEQKDIPYSLKQKPCLLNNLSISYDHVAPAMHYNFENIFGIVMTWNKSPSLKNPS